MPNPRDQKLQALRDSGTFNPRSQKVRHALFVTAGFFDPHDLLQLKYETLRALKKDSYSIAQAASEFGLSRPTIYQAQSVYQQRGLEGLLPRKRGPKNAHKLTPEVREYLDEVRSAQPGLKLADLVHQVRQRFKLKIHPRTIEKALGSKAKRGPQMS